MSTASATQLTVTPKGNKDYREVRANAIFSTAPKPSTVSGPVAEFDEPQIIMVLGWRLPSPASAADHTRPRAAAGVYRFNTVSVDEHRLY